MNQLLNKRVLITGSSRGLGLAFAKVCLQEGAQVILHGRDSQRLNYLKEEFLLEGFTVHTSIFDVTDLTQVQSAIHLIESELGPIDVLVNNAGINQRAPFLEMTYENFDTVLKANLYSVFYVGQSVAKYMAKRGEGKIINICSLLSEVARPGIPAYAVSKGGVRMLTKSMAIDLASSNIQVNGIGPGYFATEMNVPLKNNEVFDSWLKKRTPMGRWGEVEELQGALVFLASSASNFMTGQIMYIDGGILSSL